jgi:hypothetical protein
MKTNFKLLLLIILCLTGNKMHGQATWYFGNAGSMLLAGAPSNGAPSIATSEGCALVNDQSGNVVFYTDGISIWNGNHVLQAIPGPLMGHPSSTQSVIIVPAPCNGQEECERFFIFTVDAVENDLTNGFRVSLATVTGTAPATTVTISAGEHNICLWTDASGNCIPVDEKLTAIQDCNGGYWVAAHGVGIYDNTPTCTGYCGNETTFIFAHVSNAACKPGDIVMSTQAIGSKHQDGCHPYACGAAIGFNAQGQMKFSSDGRRMAVALPYVGLIDVLDFDNCTGVLSNTITLNSGSGCFAPNEALIFGIEFSPDSRMLYASSTYASYGSQNLYQYDATAGSAAAICATEYALPVISTGGSYDLGSLQLGIDGDIYLARPGQTYVSAVTDPNISGAGSNYVDNVPMATGTCALGLPTLLLNNPCEGDGGSCDQCNCGTQADLNHFFINADGTSGINLSLGAPPFNPITRLRITLVNYNSLFNPECLNCDSKFNRWGTITSAVDVYGAVAEFAPYNLSIPVDFSHEVTWCFDVPVDFPDQTDIQLGLQFPPVLNLECCRNDAEFCFRVELWTLDCRACDFLICRQKGEFKMTPKSEGSQPLPNTTPVPSNMGIKGAADTQKGSMKVIPNPASDNFQLNVDQQYLPGTVGVYELTGNLIHQSRVTNETTNLNTKAIAEGTYLVKYKSANGNFEERLVIRK